MEPWSDGRRVGRCPRLKDGNDGQLAYGDEPRAVAGRCDWQP